MGCGEAPYTHAFATLASFKRPLSLETAGQTRVTAGARTGMFSWDFKAPTNSEIPTAEVNLRGGCNLAESFRVLSLRLTFHRTEKPEDMEREDATHAHRNPAR